MPTFVRSALNPNGSWQQDGMDQVEQWNASRGDNWARWAMEQNNQRQQDDWRKEVALQQLGLQRDMWGGQRADSAEARRMEADRWGKQFDYMSGRDKLMDERERARFEQDKLDREEERNWRYENRARDVERYDAEKPMRDLQSQLALAQLAEMQRRQQAQQGASAGALYVPRTDRGKEEYAAALSMTGDPLRAGMAAKQSERESAMADAEAEAATVGRNIGKFAERDATWFSADPTQQDLDGLIKSVEALAQLYRNAGLSEPQVRARIQAMLDERAKGGDDMSRALLERFGLQP